MWSRLRKAGQHQRASDTRFLIELRRNHVGRILSRREIPSSEFADESLGFFMKTLGLRDTAADDHSLRRCDRKQGLNPVREIPSLRFPCLVIGRQLPAGVPQRCSMAGPQAIPSRQSLWNGQVPLKSSPSLRGKRTCPNSGCSAPWTRRPSQRTPAPIPVPMVIYTTFSKPAAAPIRASARHAAFTSVSSVIFTPGNALSSGFTIENPLQFGFGVGRMSPQLVALGLIWTGPNAAMPIASGVPFDENHSMAVSNVSSGPVVGKRYSSSKVPSLSPMATTVLVPPSSIAAIIREA